MKLKNSSRFTLVLFMCLGIFKTCTSLKLRSSIFGSNLLSDTAAKMLSESKRSNRDSQGNDKNGAEGIMGALLHKVSLETLNNDIKEIIQKESTGNNLGLCIFPENPYIDLGYRETNYNKCTQFLLSQESWLSEDIINKEMDAIMIKSNLSIPTKQKLKVPDISVLFKETFSQICVNFFVTLLNSNALFINGAPCVGFNCHDLFNSLCTELNDKYGKSAFILGASCAKETIKRICQETRRQLVSKYPTLIASPGDITSDGTPVEVTEPIPT